MFFLTDRWLVHFTQLFLDAARPKNLWIIKSGIFWLNPYVGILFWCCATVGLTPWNNYSCHSSSFVREEDTPSPSLVRFDRCGHQDHRRAVCQIPNIVINGYVHEGCWTFLCKILWNLHPLHLLRVREIWGNMFMVLVVVLGIWILVFLFFCVTSWSLCLAVLLYPHLESVPVYVYCWLGVPTHPNTWTASLNRAVIHDNTDLLQTML